MTLTHSTLNLQSKLTKDQKNRFKKLAQMKDEDIDTSDIPELTEEFFKNARLVVPNKTTPKTIRFNTEAINFMQKKQGKGYQTLINNMVVKWAKLHGMK